MMWHVCMMCEKEYEDNSKKSYKCPECANKEKMIKIIQLVDSAGYSLTHTKGRVRMRRKINIDKAIETVKENALRGKYRFDSKPEAIVAIQMTHRNVLFETQKCIDGKSVDFCLPELRIILEIDGDFYHTDGNKEFIRDRAIMRALGEEWEIVHISDSCIPFYTWRLDLTLPMVVFGRNEDKRFRNSSLDSEYLRHAVLCMK